MTPSISIVMPVYNAESYLHESVNSILEQTFTDFECIIVDDGSTDSSVDIIREYKDDRIRLILNRHDYIGSLNLGMNSCRGKYIARMDADDKMVPERLQVQWEFMETHPDIDVCGGWMETFDSRKMPMQHPIHSKKILVSMVEHCSLFHPTVMMKRDIIKKMPYRDDQYICYHPDYIYAEDYKFWVDLAMRGCVFANIPRLLTWYRISDTQNTHLFKKEMAVRTMQIQKEYMEYVMDWICTGDAAFYPVMRNLIELQNEDKLSFLSFRRIVSVLYGNILLKD